MARPNPARLEQRLRRVRRLIARRLVVWCLLLALPAYGLSSTLLELLGPRHVHRDAPVVTAMGKTVGVGGAMDGWVDFRRADHLTETGGRRVHSHDESRRHHHDAFDPTVITFDGPADGGSADGGSASAGSTALVLALAGTLCILPPETSRSAWARPRPTSFASRDTSPLERPPRAA